MKFPVYYTRDSKRGVPFDVQAEDAAEAAAAAWHDQHPNSGAFRPLVRFDAASGNWFVEGVEVIVYPPEGESKPCRACRGRGEVWRRAYGEGEWLETCARCNGTGKEDA